MAAGTPRSAQPAADLDRFIGEVMEKEKVPGVSAAILKDGKVAWQGTYGLAHISERRPIQRDTQFMLGSVSKLVTGLAVMKLWEQGKLSLDGDINAALPFKVRNPNHPDAPITFRQLLAHVSGIQDDIGVLTKLYSFGKDSPIRLGDFLRKYLVPNGEYYAESNYASEAPGAKNTYSNVGYALLGYLVERISGEPFDQFCRNHILGPLQMNRTAWFLRDVDVAQVAMPYEWDPKTWRQVAVGHYAYPDYPNGQLRASLPELARLVTCLAQDGELEGTRVLKPETVAEMKRVHFPHAPAENGEPSLLVWADRRPLGAKYITRGHTGSDLGVATVASFRLSDGAGVIVLENANQKPARAQIEARLWRELDRTGGVVPATPVEA